MALKRKHEDVVAEYLMSPFRGAYDELPNLNPEEDLDVVDELGLRELSPYPKTCYATGLGPECPYIMDINEQVNLTDEKGPSLAGLESAEVEIGSEGRDGFDSGPKEVKEDRILFELRKHRKVSFCRSIGNVIVVQALNRCTQSKPARLEFLPSSPIRSGDRIRVFLRNGLKPKASLKYDLEKVVEPSTLCTCFDQHRNALFCACTRARLQNKTEWIEHQGNPAFQITVWNVEDFRIYLACLVKQSVLNDFQTLATKDIHELVFQLERVELLKERTRPFGSGSGGMKHLTGRFQIFEQRFYIKCVAAPSRDVTTFHQLLGSLGLVDRVASASTLVTKEKKKKCLLVVTLSEEHQLELKRKVKQMGGKVDLY